MFCLRLTTHSSHVGCVRCNARQTSVEIKLSTTVVHTKPAKNANTSYRRTPDTETVTYASTFDGAKIDTHRTGCFPPPSHNPAHTPYNYASFVLFAGFFILSLLILNKCYEMFTVKFTNTECT